MTKLKMIFTHYFSLQNLLFILLCSLFFMFIFTAVQKWSEWRSLTKQEFSPFLVSRKDGFKAGRFLRSLPFVSCGDFSACSAALHSVEMTKEGMRFTRSKTFQLPSFRRSKMLPPIPVIPTERNDSSQLPSFRPSGMIPTFIVIPTERNKM